MVPPPSPSSTSWHSAASSTGTTKSVSFALPPYSDSSASGASLSSPSCCSSSASSTSDVRKNGQTLKSEGPAKPRPESRRRSTRSSQAFALRQSTQSDETNGQVNSTSEHRRSRIVSRRSVKRLTIAPPSSPPTHPLPELPPVVQPDAALARSQETSTSRDKNRMRQIVTSTCAPEPTMTPHTGLPYLAPSPLGACSPDGFEAIGHIALQSSTPQASHNLVVIPQAPPSYNVSEIAYSMSRAETRSETADGCPSGISHPQMQRAATEVNTIGPKHPGLLPVDESKVVAARASSMKSPTRLSMTSIAKSISDPAPQSAQEPRQPANKIDSNPATETTWFERLRTFMRVYDKSDDSSHSLPRLHRFMEPFLLLVPLLISLYLLGSAIVPFEWWRARLSIARVGLAGQSADSDERMVEGEEVGLFGVWGWCVLNSDEV